MARAKRTDRAAARRRYRAELASREASGEGEAAVERTERRPPSQPVQAASEPRPGITSAFRRAFRPADVRGDLLALPVLLRSRAFLIPLAMTGAAAALLLVQGGANTIGVLLGQYFLAPPPVASVFVAGFLAQRASWLLGAIIGAIAAFLLTAVIASGALSTRPPAATPDASPSANASAAASPSAAASGSASGAVSLSASAAASGSASGAVSPSASAAASGSASGAVSPSASAAASGNASAAASPSASAAPSASASAAASASPSASPSSASTTLPGVTSENIPAVLGQALFVSTTAGALFAAAAAWYKRFLNLANPNRRPPPPQRRSSNRSGNRR